MRKTSLLSCFALCIGLSLLPLPVHAQADLQSALQKLEKRINDQEKIISKQQQLLNAQEKEIKKQKSQLDVLSEAEKKRTASTAAPASPQVKALPQTEAPKPAEPQVVQKAETPPPLSLRKMPSESESMRPQVEALADRGGVLSPKGRLSFENTIEYTNTTRNVFAFNGVALAQVVLVGGITANTARRQIVQETGRLRLGVTDRLEVDVHAPFVYRNDAVTNTVTTSGATETTTIEGANIGDIDAGLAYQINDGKAGWPYFIGNLRYKANNADGPFDVPYDSNNIAKRLPTGTGFQTAEASLTMIKVTDPAVLFSNIGYVYDIPRDINRDFNGAYIGHVKPGDAINALAGLGFAINPDASFSLGYKHSYVFPTYQDITSGGRTVRTSSGSSQVGSLILGTSYSISPRTSINFNVEAGVTNDAPDVHLVLRVPVLLGKLY